LPWSRLEGICFDRDEKLERIDLWFPNHHVMVEGHRLQVVAEKIRVFEVQSLRALPASHQTGVDEKHPFISTLKVNELNPPSPSAVGKLTPDD